MKKVFVVLVVLFVLGSGAVFAQVSDTAQLVLSGVIGPYVNITITPAPAAGNLNLNVAQTNLLVGTAVEVSNVPYNVSASSVNGFEFTNGPESHPYELFYAGQAVSQGADIFGASQSATVGQNREIRVTYAAALGIPSGTYTDEVTFTIEQQ
ncbi:MAG: hypothetical protein EA427_08715 [Spirochaetaceae bacterium]|nr:MAG: hypothetical protein EA427_08715 [Spirochaetaceae bacterium]